MKKNYSTPVLEISELTPLFSTCDIATVSAGDGNISFKPGDSLLPGEY